MKHLAILLLGTALASTPALAQTSNQVQNRNAQPGTTATQPNATNTAQQGATAGMTGANYLTQNDPNLWRASQLAGVEIYNDRNEQIGEIDEVLIDRDGSVKAVVIGVGGFLGMGERNVAVPFQRLQWQVRANDTTAAGYGTATPRGNAGVTNTQPGTPTTTGAATTRGNATTGANPAAGTAPRTGAGTARPNDMANRNAAEDRDAPRRAILANATKAELENAPEFKYAD